MKRCLVVELWGMGDAVLMTAALQSLLEAGWCPTVLTKPAARELLAPSYPSVEWIDCVAPWTSFQGKYRLLRWPWRELGRVARELRRRRFDAAVSARKDPRDHAVMTLAGARRRVGFATPLGRPFLTVPVPDDAPDAHRVEDWWRVVDALEGRPGPRLPPRVEPDPARRAVFRETWGPGKPVVAVHCGAQVPVRRWPEAHFRVLIGRLRREFDVRLVLFPDPDGYGRSLGDLADAICEGLSLPDLAAALGAADLVIANDSGPMHLAAATGVPVAALFGPQRPAWFRPFGPGHHVVIRNLCVYRPCFDACRFPEPYCLTRLVPDEVWPEIRDFARPLLSRIAQ